MILLFYLIWMLNVVEFVLNLDVDITNGCISIMFSIFNFGWRLVCLFASYVLDASIWVKKNAGFEKKNAGFL
jgi:hypothetical protein